MKIVTMLELPAAAISLLGPVGSIVGPVGWGGELEGAEALISLVSTPIGHALLDLAPRLRVVANAGVGFDNIDLHACRSRGITVTNTPDVVTDATADLTLALILSTVRRTPQAEASLRRGEFHGWGFWDYLGGDLQDARLGIVGMGRIGQAVALRARSFGLDVHYTSRTRLDRDREEELEICWSTWEDLLESCDILSLHAPYTSETRHLLDAAAIGRMRASAYVINTARGPLIDEDALVRALESGRLAGAGLDVYEKEPTIHPGLLALDNVVLLPHVGSATRRTRTRMATLAARNVAAVLSGEPALTPVPFP